MPQQQQNNASLNRCRHSPSECQWPPAVHLWTFAHGWIWEMTTFAQKFGPCQTLHSPCTCYQNSQWPRFTRMGILNSRYCTRWADECHMIQGSGLYCFLVNWQNSMDKKRLLSKQWPRLLYPLLSHGIGDIHLFGLDKQGNVKAQKHSSIQKQMGTQVQKRRMKILGF